MSVSYASSSTAEIRKQVLKLYKDVNARSAEVAIQRSELEREATALHSTLATLDREIASDDAELLSLQKAIRESEAEIAEGSRVVKEVELVQDRRAELHMTRIAFDRDMAHHREERQKYLDNLRKEVDRATHNITAAEAEVESLRTKLSANHGPRLSAVAAAEETLREQVQDAKGVSHGLEAQLNAGMNRMVTEEEALRGMEKDLATAVEALRKVRGRNETVSDLAADVAPCLATLRQYIALTDKKHREGTAAYQRARDALEPVALCAMEAGSLSPPLEREEEEDGDISLVVASPEDCMATMERSILLC